MSSAVSRGFLFGFRLSYMARNILWSVKMKGNCLAPWKQQRLHPISLEKGNICKRCQPHVVKAAYSLIMLQFGWTAHTSRRLRAIQTRICWTHPSTRILHAWRILSFATFSCRKFSQCLISSLFLFLFLYFFPHFSLLSLPAFFLSPSFLPFFLWSNLS